MTVVNGQVLDVILEMTLEDGTVMQNHFSFKAEFDADQTDSNVANAVETWLEAAYANLVTHFPNTMTFDRAILNELTWNAVKVIWEKTREVGEFFPTITPTATGEELPNQTSGFCILGTARPRTKGRIFLAPFTEGAQDAGNIVSAVVGSMGAFVVDAIADKTISPSNILRRVVVRAGVDAVYDILSGVVNSILGTQRRRRPGVGA